MTKKEWLGQKILVDEWGRPPSLADVPLTYMTRKQSFQKRRITNGEINKSWEIDKIIINQSKKRQ